MNKKISLFFILMILAGALRAQSISVSANDQSFAEFISALERDTDYRFFYDVEEMDSLRVTIDMDGSLDQVLSGVFNGTVYHAAILFGNNVVITSQKTISTQLPTGYFVRNSAAPAELDLAALNFEEEDFVIEAASDPLENTLIEIGNKTPIRDGVEINLAGYVRREDSGEGVVGAMVFIDEPRIATVTDSYGYYNITLPQGRHTLRFRSVGLRDTKREIVLFSEGTLDVEMIDDVIALKEVVVQAEKSANVTGMQMGMERLDISKVKQVPTVLGEADIVKIALTLPGVQTVGEGTAGFNVRGGGADQNLITINEATIYNPSHFFGFFSVFNPDIIKNATLMKSGIPAQYGGRVSSVFEVNTRDGNKRKFGVRGGISPVTARLTLEGPIIKDKTSFIIGGRSTYSDWLLNQIPDSNVKNSEASFYDLSGKITHTFSDKDALFVSGYYSKDKFKLFSDSLINYENLNASAQWKHSFNNKLIMVITGAYSDYKFNVNFDSDSLRSFDLNYRLQSYNGKLDFSYFPKGNNKLDFGIATVLHELEPGNQVPINNSEIVPVSLEPEKALESAVYIGDNFDINSKLSVYLGLRYSFYQYLGPKTVYGYLQGVPKSPATLVDTTQFSKNEVIQNYHGPEYRFSARYTLDPNSSIKLSYNRMRQYIHVLSNTTAISPTDTWKLSDTNIRPQVGDQVALGYYRNFRNNSIETSVEVYYKTIEDVLDYKGGAQLILNETIEQDLLSAFNRSYGVEFLIKKKVGKLDGWISYTYSRSLNRVDGDFAEETINDGEFFPANFDKPHSLNVIANYKFTRRVNISSSFTYSTGRPVTYPVAKYRFRNSERVYYSERNEFRIPDYIRLDLSLQVEGNHKVDKPAHSSWSFAVYNLLGRRNAYSVFFLSEQGDVNGYKLSIFGSAIPTITYNFRF